MAKKPSTIFVGMSGGVDSSVTAALLIEQGYSVVGAFMKNWSESPQGGALTCTWEDERRDALRVAAQLGIPFMTFDFEAEYRAAVAEYLYREYEAGRTPNPDVLCNKHVKFDLFLRRALAEGADFIATGHYARVRHGGGDGAQLLAAADDAKDQTYFLHQLDAAQLSKTLFPIGHLRKTEVRAIARRLGLPTAEKKDSTGICFIGNVDMRSFLARRIPEKRGDIIDASGRKLGEHRGAAAFTVGQRHGLDVGGGKALFVVAKDVVLNTVTVTDDAHDPALYRTSLVTERAHWIAGAAPSAAQFSCKARLRHRQPLQDAVVLPRAGGSLRVDFATPQRAVAPGQFVVFYADDVCLGGAVIA